MEEQEPIITVDPVWRDFILPYMDEKGFDYEEIKVNGVASRIIFKLENLLIENEKGKSHIIKEIFVSFDMYSNKIGNICGARRLFTHVEAYSKYSHSHLNTSYMGTFASFCLGDSPIANYAATGLIEPNEINAQMFFILLMDYLGTESIAGGPYIYMDSIGADTRTLTDSDVRCPLPLPFKSHEGFTYRVVDEEAVIDKLWIIKQLEPNCYFVNGQHKPLGNSPRRDSVKLQNELRSIIHPFTFKGEIMAITIIEPMVEDAEQKISDEYLTVHPNTIRQYADHIKSKLKVFLIQQDHVARQISNDSTIGSLEEDDVPLFSGI